MADRSRYQGKRLLYLLLSFGVPILLLYFSMAASIIAAEAHIRAEHIARFTWAARILAALFYTAQLLCALYLRRAFFARKVSKLSATLQYIAVLAAALLCSICGAIACEAFGYNLFLRVMQRGI